MDDSSPVEGGTFTLSATVRNAGDGESATTTLRFYRSTDGTILTSDTEVGTAAVAGLAAAGSTSASVQLTAPATAGTYDYGACVDAVADESNTANNCSSSVQVTVSEPVATTSNRAPQATGSIPDVTLIVNGAATTIDIAAHFSDPDDDTLSYSVSSTGDSVTVSISGSAVSLAPVHAGTAMITVSGTRSRRPQCRANLRCDRGARA